VAARWGVRADSACDPSQELTPALWRSTSPPHGAVRDASASRFHARWAAGLVVSLRRPRSSRPKQRRRSHVSYESRSEHASRRRGRVTRSVRTGFVLPCARCRRRLPDEIRSSQSLRASSQRPRTRSPGAGRRSFAPIRPDFHLASGPCLWINSAPRSSMRGSRRNTACGEERAGAFGTKDDDPADFGRSLH
jgi:hypothetical protein